MITEQDVISNHVVTIKHIDHDEAVYWSAAIFKAVLHDDGFFYWEHQEFIGKLFNGDFPPKTLMDWARTHALNNKIPFRSKLSITRNTKKGSCMYFRELNEEETKEFQKYAEENDPDLISWSIYHPVCREVWLRRGFEPLPLDEKK